MNGKRTIAEDQSEIARALQSLPKYAQQLPEEVKPLLRIAPPKGKQVEVSLRHAKTKRQVKRNAPGDSWSPGAGFVSVSYGDDPSPQSNSQGDERVAPFAPAPSSNRVHDLILALARAEDEDDPQRGFVALKWFRDAYLLQQSYGWAVEQRDRQQVLAEAIQKNWILTSKAPNPNNPAHPVTTIRLNRSLGEVREILRRDARGDSDFAPLTIAGELLSETVLRERR